MTNRVTAVTLGTPRTYPRRGLALWRRVDSLRFCRHRREGQPLFQIVTTVDSAAAVRTGRIKLLGCNLCAMLLNELTTLKSFGQTR